MKSLDLQMLLPKSTEVAKARHVEQQRPATAQQQFAIETRRQLETQQRTVHRADSARGGKISKDGRRGGSGASPRQGDGHRYETPTPSGANTSRRENELSGEQDGKGKFIDIVLGAMDGWGNCW